jgi:hypothetical protein
MYQWYFERVYVQHAVEKIARMKMKDFFSKRIPVNRK